jgi:mannonate dehydratase
MLKIVNEDGIYGLADADSTGRELAVASYLSDHVVPLLIGRDPRRIEDTWQYLYRGAYWRRGFVTMSAVAAVDTALWDVKAKSLNTPLYQLLGGASRDAVLVYGHASGAGIEETVQAVSEYGKAGYKAVRAQSRIPGLTSSYGVGKGNGHYEPPEKGVPPENAWSSEAYMKYIFRRSSPTCGRSSVQNCIYCMWCTTEHSNPTTYSGWRTRPQRDCRKASG